jgi:glutamyl-tRNA reductase
VLGKARQMLANNRDPQDVHDFLANTLTNKLTHTPSVRMREAAEVGDQALLDAALRLLGPDKD